MGGRVCICYQGRSLCKWGTRGDAFVLWGRMKGHLFTHTRRTRVPLLPHELKAFYNRELIVSVTQEGKGRSSRVQAPSPSTETQAVPSQGVASI